MSKKTFTQYILVLISLFSAAIAVCSLLSIPFVIPFTLQVFAVFLAVFTMGLKWGTASVLAYIMLGLVGLPVFSSFQGGFQALFSVNGGFVFGFIIMSAVTGILLRKVSFKLKNLFLCGFIGVVVLYLCELLWLICVYSFNPIAALMLVIAYFPLDILKMFFAGMLSLKLRKVIKINEFA